MKITEKQKTTLLNYGYFNDEIEELSYEKAAELISERENEASDDFSDVLKIWKRNFEKGAAHNKWRFELLNKTGFFTWRNGKQLIYDLYSPNVAKYVAQVIYNIYCLYIDFNDQALVWYRLSYEDWQKIDHLSEEELIDICFKDKTANFSSKITYNIAKLNPETGKYEKNYNKE